MEQDNISDLNKYNVIRYLAIYGNGQLYSQLRSDVEYASTNESDKYEELLVNPVLPKLATQMGNIDCGGRGHIVVGYRHLNQLIRNLKDGHISICLSLEADLNTMPHHIINYNENCYSAHD